MIGMFSSSASLAYPAALQKEAQTLLPVLREAVGKVEAEGKRLAVIAYARPRGMRPSAVRFTLSLTHSSFFFLSFMPASSIFVVVCT